MLVDKKFFELLLEEFVNANTDDEGRWITIKPHGDDSEDYRRLKLRKGESPKEAIERVYKKEDKKEKKEDKGKDIYSKLITKDIEKTLRDSVKAQKYDNPKAKIGDTMLDSDRIISRFSSNLTSKEYDKFDWEKAEYILFEKLKEIEKEFGFKQDDKKEDKEKKEKVVSIFDYKYKQEDLMEKFVRKFLKNDDYVTLHKASKILSSMNKQYLEKNLDVTLSDTQYKEFKEDLKDLAQKGDEALSEKKTKKENFKSGFRQLTHEEKKEKVKKFNEEYKKGNITHDELLEFIAQHDKLKYDSDRDKVIYDKDDLTAFKEEKSHKEKIKRFEKNETDDPIKRKIIENIEVAKRTLEMVKKTGTNPAYQEAVLKRAEKSLKQYEEIMSKKEKK